MKHLYAVCNTHSWKKFPGDPSALLASVLTEGELEGESIKRTGGKNQ